MSKKLLWFGRILGGLAVLIFTGGFILVFIGTIIEEGPPDTNSNYDTTTIDLLYSHLVSENKR